MAANQSQTSRPLKERGTLQSDVTKFIAFLILIVVLLGFGKYSLSSSSEPNNHEGTIITEKNTTTDEKYHYRYSKVVSVKASSEWIRVPGGEKILWKTDRFTENFCEVIGVGLFGKKDTILMKDGVYPQLESGVVKIKFLNNHSSEELEIFYDFQNL
jgi:hypothetical protein